MLFLALLKGLAQGFLVTAPAMLIMRLLGKEGALGTAQSIGAIIAAVMMYVIGRMSGPQHRVKIFAAGLIFFTLAALANGILFNATGVIIFMLFLLLAKPLMDLAYFPIQFNVIDVLSKIEKRSEFAYILNHEAGLYVGRFLGAATFSLAGLRLFRGSGASLCHHHHCCFAAELHLGVKAHHQRMQGAE